MCLVAFNWSPQADVPLVMVSNRDEFRARPARAMHWWQRPEILAGQDLQAQGTWFAIDRTGRFALVTNVRPGYVGARGEKSRGQLPIRFLNGGASIETFHRDLSAEIADYGGFNLILGEPGRLFWFSSDHPQGCWVEPGMHTLCNAALDTPWPKSRLAAVQLSDQLPRLQAGDLQAPILHEQFRFDDQLLPHTGVSLEWERMLSAQTIVDENYGTRCRTWLRYDAGGNYFVDEAQIDLTGQITDVKSFRWTLSQE